METKQNELAVQACMKVAQHMISEKIHQVEILQGGKQGLKEGVVFRSFAEDNTQLEHTPSESLRNAVGAYMGMREPYVGASFHDAGGLMRATITKTVGDGRYEIMEDLCFFQKGLVPELAKKYNATTLANLAIELHQNTKNNDELIDYLLETLTGIKQGSEVRIEVSSSKTEGHYRFITDEQQQIDPDSWGELYEVFAALAKSAFPNYANEGKAIDGGLVALRAKKNENGVVEVELSNWDLDLKVVNQRESNFNHRYVTPNKTLKTRTTPYLSI